jgi:biopolymer transport protein ExbB
MFLKGYIMNAEFSLKEMFLLGWPILSVLILCSIISIAIIWQRLVYFKRLKLNVHHFFENIQAVLSAGNRADEQCKTLNEPMASITRFALLYSKGSKESLELAVDRSIRLQVAEAEKFVPFLGTIAAAAPFIGLLGTVIGIIRAFRSLALTGSSGPQVVAGGIAEALVATAVGLMVAIPALVAYNYFSTLIRRMTESMEICADALVELLINDK